MTTTTLLPILAASIHEALAIDAGFATHPIQVPPALVIEEGLRASQREVGPLDPGITGAEAEIVAALAWVSDQTHMERPQIEAAWDAVQASAIEAGHEEWFDLVCESLED